MTERNQAITRKDVAKRAGVSETIVSYVVNNNRYVSAEKRERVLSAIQELHYCPNPVARALRGKRSGQILFIAENLANDYFGRLVQELDKEAYSKDFLVSLLATKNEPEFVQQILSRQVDAVIISSASLKEDFINQLLAHRLPVVLMMTRDYASVTGPVARVYTGIESGMMAAVRTLYEGGCRHLVYVDRVSANLHFSDRRDLRYRGFCNQLEALGMSPSGEHFISGCQNHEQLSQAIRERILSGEPVDGFLCRNDRLAAIVLNACQACGKRVPEEISIIGFDNAELCKVVSPNLSTVDKDLPGIAHACLELIESMLSGQEPEERHLLTRLILRGTTRSQTQVSPNL